MFDLEMVKRNFPFEKKFGQKISGPRQKLDMFDREMVKKIFQEKLLDLENFGPRQSWT